MTFFLSFEIQQKTLTHLQKNKKYGAVVSMITTHTWSSSSVRQNMRNGTIIIIKQHENKNITRDGAVIYTIELEYNWIRIVRSNGLFS